MTFCKMAVEAHGGTIGVDSVEGEGSTFWFVLPYECANKQVPSKAKLPGDTIADELIQAFDDVHGSGAH